jgi:hypothetical protein
MLRSSAYWISVGIALGAVAACRQREPRFLAGRCFAFDSAAFAEVGYDTSTGAIAADAAHLIELLERPHPTEVGAFALRAHGLGVRDDPDSGRDEYSYWRPLNPDSVEIVWREGLYGPVLRLSVRNRTLEGTLRQTTDVFPDPDAGRTWHVRAGEARCPLPSRPAA